MTTFRNHYSKWMNEKVLNDDSSIQLPDFIPVSLTAEPQADTSPVCSQNISVTIGKASIAIAPGFNSELFKSVVSILTEIC